MTKEMRRVQKLTSWVECGKNSKKYVKRMVGTRLMMLKNFLENL